MKINKLIRVQVRIFKGYNYLYKNLDAIVLGKDCHNIGEHDWRYNFPSMPNKRICTVCKRKERLYLEALEWKKANEPDFNYGGRSYQELIDKWVY